MYNPNYSRLENLRITLKEHGLTACAMFFTMVLLIGGGFSLILGALCLVFMAGYGFSKWEAGGWSIAVAAAVLLACMIVTWRFLARVRSLWVNVPEATWRFHLFQGLAILVCFLFSLSDDCVRHYGPLAFSLFEFSIEVIVFLFFLSYIFLGLTLRCKFSLSSFIGLGVSAGSVWWAYHRLPKMW